MMHTAKSIADIKQIAFFSRFTDEQIRNQIRGNIAGLQGMLARAEKTGKKQGGYTPDQLRGMIANYENILAAG